MDVSLYSNVWIFGPCCSPLFFLCFFLAEMALSHNKPATRAITSRTGTFRRARTSTGTTATITVEHRCLEGIEHHRTDNWFGGLSLFNNSYGQFAQYLYLGKKFHPWESHPEVRIKLSAGVVHGYRGEHNTRCRSAGAEVGGSDSFRRSAIRRIVWATT